MSKLTCYGQGTMMVLKYRPADRKPHATSLDSSSDRPRAIQTIKNKLLFVFFDANSLIRYADEYTMVSLLCCYKYWGGRF